MTIDEVCERYCIPKSVLEEYEKLGLCSSVKCVMGQWQYDDTDVERLSLIMTLHDVGFTNEEVEAYMGLLLSGGDTREARLKMLDKLRQQAVDEIHFHQKKLDWLDYLRYQIRQHKEKVL
ncbi:MULTISPECIES: MerR family transcriptional regulator [Megasphaera]|jgi:DNA-binding transcriptional MerR regulator|uniref:MerR family transcriptional regulator n=1 Tax=Megasphaera TaxID=906 RepID=UPI000B3BC287|nr:MULTISPECIES: MerR family transcriptional regulator [Megasphaera]MDN0046384.1 MerR family transcriptional regulator [Megasphaera hexanoica]OUO48422.1 MerR family transcriptional regulator [Megasphaera sp. An286]HJE83894.1 MerR family transcriptional regulator [Megasphaera stantonii]